MKMNHYYSIGNVIVIVYLPTLLWETRPEYFTETYLRNANTRSQSSGENRLKCSFVYKNGKASIPEGIFVEIIKNEAENYIWN